MPVENYIKVYRKARGWSQEQLAEKSGVSRSAISETENGSHVPTLEAAMRIAKAMNTTVDKLFRLV